MVFLLHKMVMITKKITRKNFPQKIFAFGCNMLMFVTTTSSLSSVTSRRKTECGAKITKLVLIYPFHLDYI